MIQQKMDLTTELLHLFKGRVSKSELENMDNKEIEMLVDSEINYLERTKYNDHNEDIYNA